LTGIARIALLMAAVSREPCLIVAFSLAGL
jgi:hypothetical protein